MISVITPYRNGIAYLDGFVRMMRNQTLGVWQCLMVDDRSTDGGPDLLATLVDQDPRFVLLAMKDGGHSRHGPAASRNYALGLATGQWVAFCDIDDLWHPCKLERQFACVRNSKSDLLVSGYGRFCDRRQQLLEFRCPPSCLSYRQLLGSNPIPMLTVLVRTELVRGGMPNCRHEDFAMWLKLFRDHPQLRYVCVPEVLAFYRVHSNNLTGQRWRMSGWAWQVFWTHGLRGSELLLAMGRWCIHQLFSVLHQRFFNPLKAPHQLNVLLSSPPVRLQQRNS